MPQSINTNFASLTKTSPMPLNRPQPPPPQQQSHPLSSPFMGSHRFKSRSFATRTPSGSSRKLPHPPSKQIKPPISYRPSLTLSHPIPHPLDPSLLPPFPPPPPTPPPPPYPFKIMTVHDLT